MKTSFLENVTFRKPDEENSEKIKIFKIFMRNNCLLIFKTFSFNGWEIFDYAYLILIASAVFRISLMY